MSWVVDNLADVADVARRDRQDEYRRGQGQRVGAAARDRERAVGRRARGLPEVHDEARDEYRAEPVKVKKCACRALSGR